MVWLDGQGLGKSNWKHGDIEIWGRCMRIEFSENRKIFVSHGNAPQRVTSEEDFKNQTARMATLGLSVSLTPQAAHVAQWAQEQRGRNGCQAQA